MILDIIQIIRARRDKSLASKLGLRFAQGQLLDRAAAPLLIVHLCLWVGVIIMGAIAAGLFAAAIEFHEAITIVALIPLAISLASAWVSIRLKTGLDRIRTLADGYSDSQIDRMFVRNAAHHSGPDSVASAAPLHSDNTQIQYNEDAP